MFFDTITSIQNLKKKYRELAYQHHPDHGGDEDMMKRINAEYEKVRLYDKCYGDTLSSM